MWKLFVLARVFFFYCAVSQVRDIVVICGRGGWSIKKIAALKQATMNINLNVYFL